MTYPTQALIDRTWPHGVTPNWDATRDVTPLALWFREHGLRAYTSGGGTDDTFVYHHGKYWFMTEPSAFAFKMRWGVIWMVPLGAFNHFVNSFPHQVWIGSELNRSHTDIHVWCAKRFGMIARYAPRRDGAWYFCSRGYAFKDPRAAVEFKMRWG